MDSLTFVIALVFAIAVAAILVAFGTKKSGGKKGKNKNRSQIIREAL